MSDPALLQSLGAYEAGLDAELRLLERLEALADAQRDAVEQPDPKTLTAWADERQALLASLVALEDQLRPVRVRLSDERAQLMHLARFVAIADKHKRAADLAHRIVTADKATLGALRDAEQARRFAAQAIEAGENTLAAYRRVVSPAPSHAALINRRG